MKNIFDTKPLSVCSKTLLSIVRVRDYRCPKCKQMHNDDENGKIKYPICVVILWKRLNNLKI